MIQIVLSFLLKPEIKEKNYSYKPIKTFKKLIKNEQIRNCLKSQFLIGFNISDGALEILMTILIFNSFKTNFNLGIITSLSTLLTIIFTKLYGKFYKNKDDKRVIIISSILPVLSLIILLFFRNNFTVIMYNFCYVIFANILCLTMEIRLLNISDSYLVNKEDQAEFLSAREGALNLGRVIGYVLLLLSGLYNSELLLNITMVILTLSILLMGIYVKRLNKFE